MNLSLMQGFGSDDEKSVRVTPLFKNNDLTELEKCWTVPILNTVSI